MRLQNAIKSKKPGLLTREVILLYDNVTPNLVDITQSLFKSLQWTIFYHQPHSPDSSQMTISYSMIRRNSSEDSIFKMMIKWKLPCSNVFLKFSLNRHIQFSFSFLLIFQKVTQNFHRNESNNLFKNFLTFFKKNFPSVSFKILVTLTSLIFTIILSLKVLVVSISQKSRL